MGASAPTKRYKITPLRAISKTLALRPALFPLSEKKQSLPYGICCPKNICCEKGRMGEAGSDPPRSDLDYGNRYHTRCRIFFI